MEILNIAIEICHIHCNSLFLFQFQRTKTNIKIFSDPMPRSNERSVQLMGSIAQIVECVQHILDDIGKVCIKCVKIDPIVL